MKVGVFTDARSEYSHLFYTMKEITKREKLELITIVTGMHLLEKFGYSKQIIEKDGFTIDYEISVPEFRETTSYMTEISGKIITELGKIFEEKNVELLLILGDRFESLAAATAAFLSNIPIAHIAGGDLSGNIDDSIRHAITKLSHIHFCLTETSAERVKKLGEEDWRINVVGSPSLDYVFDESILLKEHEIRKKFNIPTDDPYILILMHPETGYKKLENLNDQVHAIMSVLKELQIETIFIYPNYEMGGDRIINEIEHAKRHNWIKVYKNLPTEEYLSLLKYSFLIMGNSSSGIIESSALGIPSLNLGTRQNKRERDVNVIDLPFEKQLIIDAIKKLQEDEEYYSEKSNTQGIYGKGKTATKICDILENVKIDIELLNKKNF
ncbi:MAG: UDP-N-acetylglucosamine 2-epimerase (hydrolyzing) [Candidatus Heimdallarchaeota archaeon]|nr:UDP-N-acetylglucosamine 2-epimerase (hydrolyzing) [Candidatus Heimdallarchaeota archaeon]